jgi:hypothetical protein
MARRDQVLAARGTPFDRTGKFARGPRDHQFLGIDRGFAAESTTDIRRDHPHLPHRQTENARQILARPIGRLGREPGRERAIVPVRQRGARFERGRRDEGVLDDRLDHHRRARKRVINIAHNAVGSDPLHAFARRRHRKRLHIEGDQRGRVARRRPGGGNHRGDGLAGGLDRLAGKQAKRSRGHVREDDVDGSLTKLAEIGGAKHGDDALGGARLFQLKRAESAMRIGTADKFQMQAPVGQVIVDIGPRAGNETTVFDAGQAPPEPARSRLTDIAACIQDRLSPDITERSLEISKHAANLYDNRDLSY